MRQLIRNISICISVFLMSLWLIYPPEKQLRLGRDLGGGTSLVYLVQLGPDDDEGVIPRIIEVIKQRVDPDGLSEVQFVQRGKDRIEITMPAPTPNVVRLKKAYEEELAKLGVGHVDPAHFERMMRLDPPERLAEVERVTSDATRRERFRVAGEAFDQARTARAAVEAMEPELKSAQAAVDAAAAELRAAVEANREQSVRDELQAKLNQAQSTADALRQRFDSAVEVAAEALDLYDRARTAAMGSRLTVQEVRRALSLSDQARALRDDVTGKVERIPSPRETTLKRLSEAYPEDRPALDAIVKAFNAYTAERRGLDDPADLKRLIANAGVLSFRITVRPGGGPGGHEDEARLRQELRERGPRGVRSNDARWYKINRIENWYDSAQELAMLSQSPAEFFRLRGYVVEAYDGEYYMLGWDTPGTRLTRADGDWGVRRAYIGPDQRGIPAIKFEMDARGGVKLGDLTKNHVQKQMAVLLDDEVYTAPTLQSRISNSGEITGKFSDAELNYVVRVLSAGSLQAKLSPEPISQSTLGPELGQDNLDNGLNTGKITFGVVAAFMIVYYFSCGGIAVIALGFNFVLVLGIMALNKAAFTLPGIAGLVLTFGQAVDANVLIYERMREEFLRGADMKTAVRLGFSRAASSIIDGNLTNLIVCIVLYRFGTTEIRGFAITLGIGVITTLFTAVFFSRLIFTIFVDYLGWRRASQLPMKVPVIQRIMTPNVDWMRLRHVTLGALAIFLVAGGIIAWQRGAKMLDTEFRGGTQVEVKFKDGPDGKPLTRTRMQVEELVRSIGKEAKPGSPLRIFSEAEVLPVNPQDDNITSDRFKITLVATEDEGEARDREILSALSVKLQDLIESRPSLEFIGRDEPEWRRGPVYPILSSKLGDDIQLRAPGASAAAITDDVSSYLGGVAIVLENVSPPVARTSIVERLETVRQQADFSDTLGRVREVRILQGNEREVTAAVILVRDDELKSFDNEAKWGMEVAAREWRLTVDALARPSQMARMDTISRTIADTFAAQAVVSVLISLVLLTVYVWVRFGAGRWAVAATVPLFADVVGILGLIALAQILYETPSTQGFAAALGILPFKIDLAQIAALLTITGYSLNDKIIIMDRIRENKGKLPYASYKVINDSINQTLSRTFITSGTTLFSTVALYLYGGEGIRGFAFAFTFGVIIGTYTSIVSSPLVWSRKYDKPTTPATPSEAPAIAGAAASLPSGGTGGGGVR